MKNVLKVLSSILLAIMLLAGCTKAQDNYIVKTNYGEVRGFQEDEVLIYRGIPFAAAPVDELRFAPPQPLTAWEGVLDCTSFSSFAMQTDGPLIQELKAMGVESSEDCLTLDIWRTAEDEEKMPVLVYIHGGAFAQGAPSVEQYGGTRFAKDGVVQVNIAYRLNALGFMPNEEIAEKYGTYGSVGLLDQIQALKWVKENIEYFGGDPERITICGESAGAVSVSNIVMSPKAEGLFQQAIIESGTTLSQAVTMPFSNGSLDQALENTKRLMDSIGVDTLEELQQMDALDIAHKSVFSMDMINPSKITFAPVYDGEVLPKDPLSAIKNGDFNKVKLLIGYNTDEGASFIEDQVSEADYEQFLQNIFPKNAKRVRERFPVDERYTAVERAREIVTLGFRAGCDLFAEQLYAAGETSYLYNFDYVTPELKEAGLGSVHAMELNYVFDSFDDDIALDADQRAFIEEVHNRWLNFIKSGDPNEGVSFDIQWLPYTPNGKESMVLNERSHMESLKNLDDVEFITELIPERYQ